MEISNSYLKLKVIAENGGKVSSLASVVSGREWLWLNSALPISEPVYGCSYVEELDSGGWDDMFPSILPCEVALDNGATMQVPDHGDLPALPAKLKLHSGNSVRSTIHGRCVDYIFTRTLALDGPTLRAKYQVENTGNTVLPWTWFAHPLLKLEAGMQLLAEKGLQFNVVATEGAAAHATGDTFSWPGAVSLPDVSAEGFEGYAIKYFSESEQCSSFACRTADGSETLRLNWDANTLPHVGVWLNCAGWHAAGDEHYFNIGIEPSTGPDDGLDEAVKHDRARILEPGTKASWNFDIVLETGDSL